MSGHARTRSSESDNLIPPPRAGKDGRSYSNAGSFNPRSGTSSAASAIPPGSFNSDLKATPRADYFGNFQTYGYNRSHHEDDSVSLQKQAEYREKIDKERKIKVGSENLLEALSFKPAKQTRDQRLRIESEIDSSNRKISQLQHDLDVEVRRAREPRVHSPGELTQLFHGGQNFSPSSQDAGMQGDMDNDIESPTYILAETLQSLEADVQSSDYYVQHANNLAELFKRHPTLKYDLVWSVFGLRVQGLLLSDSREVAASGFRMLRYAITDRKSLSIMRSFHTDYIVILSLVKEGKANVEREQALKLVRAFLDVKGGAEELPRALVRVIVAIAENSEDRLRNICLLTLSELLIRKPDLVESAGGIGVLTDALSEGLYYPSGSLTAAFLYLLESPVRRKHLRSGHELDGPFAAFTENNAHMNEERLKTNARVVVTLLKTWSGLIALSMNGFMAVKSLTSSLFVNSSIIRDIVLEIILDVLRIKPPAWSSSFLAGRRLTTYGRVGHLGGEPYQSRPEEEKDKKKQEELVDHFTSLLLIVFLQSGLVESLLYALRQESEQSIKRKAMLLTGETLDLANKILPSTWTASLQVLPGLFNAATMLGSDNRFSASSIVYQIDSVNRTLFRTGQTSRLQLLDDSKSGANARRTSDLHRDTLTAQIEDGVFKAVLLESQVPNTPNWQKWRWDLIQKIVEGPLLNPKRLEEAAKNSKFLKRLIGFYRPFKYRFCDIRNTKPNQRYVRIGCALMRTLLQNNEGVKYLSENKLLRQLAECLAQLDRLSGLTSMSPLFSEQRINSTLTGGYFALIGAISSNARGLAILERWKMANMFYHIVELTDSDELITILLSSMDYTIDSHLRVILSKTLTSCSKDTRVFSTKLLRKYALGKSARTDQSQELDSSVVEWAVDLLITQLYDPEVEVCENAIKILEEACNEIATLEHVVQCRPVLDHLGEIGAPLLLRFLSTSVGYHYLEELDYISQEMDDWFLGRNEAYVTQVEASIARALAGPQEIQLHIAEDAEQERRNGVAPPHFYRELTRTAEGCRLLETKGHFEEFAAAIRSFGLEKSDAETILKVKGSLWAVGNIGCMGSGAPFLEGSDVVEHIIRIAQGSDIMSMRGTAFFVLGLISRSVPGQELLAERDWEVAVDERGNSQGICLPSNLPRLFRMEPWTSQGPGFNITKGYNVGMASLTDDDPVNQRILNLVNDLGNTVLAKSRAAELHR